MLNMGDEEAVGRHFDVPEESSKNPQGKRIRSGQKQMAYNLYLELKGDNSKSASIKLTSKQLGIGEKKVWDIVKEMETTGIMSSPTKIRKRESTYDHLDETQKSTIRRHVHSFFLRNELPSCTKILSVNIKYLTCVNYKNNFMKNLQVCNADDTLPEIGLTTLWKILKKLGFKWEKRGRNNILMERQDIILWRRRYLTKIRSLRAQGKKIYYLDETWVNAGHTKPNVWKDTTIHTARQAFIDGVSVGLKNPSGKGSRLIILHIGSETGFVENGLLCFESKKTGDYHEDMNSERFTEWMKNILPSLEPGSVIVMDNAPYHSVKLEKTPTTAWKKAALIEWLLSKGIDCDSTMLKVELLELTQKYINDNPVGYVIDQMVEESGRTVLRLPPYHCNLNPIEMIWAQVKHHVAANNKTFKLSEVKALLNEGLQLVSAEAWAKCVQHTIKEEKKMYDLDNIVEDMIEEFVIIANTGSSSDLSISSSE